MSSPAVAFLVFNRPETTKRVLDAIRSAKPPRLYVVADGPRASRPDDQERCAAVRRLVMEGIDWPCTLRTDFAQQNLGCGRRIASGLDWVFQQEEEVVVLEDDCVPDATFFPYCAELLDRYRSDERVGMIAGSNFLADGDHPSASYFFSAYNFIWGWAAWRRSWSLYDLAMRAWPERRDSPWLRDWLQSRRAAAHWRRRFDAMYAGRVDTWDYPWTFSLWSHHLLTVIPGANLVTNIGFGRGATHSPDADQRLSQPATPLSFPLRHPETVTRDLSADHAFEREVFCISWKDLVREWLPRRNHV